jgi:hypothetical protein
MMIKQHYCSYVILIPASYCSESYHCIENGFISNVLALIGFINV